jgi:hypothetical protein
MEKETLEEDVLKDITSYNELMDDIGVEDGVDYKELKQDEFDKKSAIKWALFGAKWQQEDVLKLLKANGYEDEPIFDLITEQFKKK